MKQLTITYFMICCFALTTNAQSNFNYSEAWQKVENLEKEGLTTSALDLVESIFTNATKDKLKTERIKSLLYKSKYTLILEEDAQLNIVNQFRTEIDNSDVVTKHLLENMLATMYWQYFQQNRWKFFNRTNTASKVDENDFRTWDLETLFNEINIYYQRSLENGLLLQQEPIEDYESILINVKDSKTYRPTLFDLLAHNALQFYKTDENSITQPAYQFKIDNPDYVSDSYTFSNIDITSKDSSSLQLNALKVYQQLLKFHHKKKDSKPFASVDIERLNFAHQKATFSNKDDILLNTLKKTAEAIKRSEQSALYNFEIASLYQRQGNLYNSDKENTDNQWRLKDAVELCDAVISEFPESDGAKKCEILKAQLLLPSITIKTERYIPINKASKFLVTYKNLDDLEFSIYKISEGQLNTYNKLYREDKKAAFFDKLKAQKSFNATLKNEGDYQTHSTEIVFPKLENGIYLIKADTNTNDKVFATTPIYITNMALVDRTENDKTIYQLINRNTGKPIIGAIINISYNTNRNNRLSRTLTSNNYGQFEFTKDRNYYREVKIKVTHNNEKAYFGDFYISRSYKDRKSNDTQYNTFLFTDRSIYRPSQTVYFKGIATQTITKVSKVTTDESVTVTLHNVNGEELSKQELKTNDFGSFSGEFILPNSGLTGQFYIKTNSNKLGSRFHYFSVEEYKRPKFKPEFDPITETYKVNDSVTIKGKAMAFAGSAITDAKVVYRVKRNVQYPRWYYWYRPYGFGSESQEITFGETKTNNKGEFDISFKALPDESASKEFLPVFNYEVTADVTDINGETRSTTTIVNVGYHSMVLNISAPQQLDKTEKEAKLNISSTNLNGETVSTKGTLKIYKLNPPNKVLRQRPWEAPDYQMISKEEFKTLFPHEAYTNEDKLSNWTKGKEVFNTTFNTEDATEITLKRFKNWDSGKYSIVAESKDPFGQDVKDETYITLFSNTDKTVADKQLIEFQLNKTQFEVGDVAKLTLGSASENITLTVTTEKQGEIINTQLITLNNNKKTIKIPIEKDDVGGFVVHYSFAFANAYKTQSIPIRVPYPKTDLQIETATFRDKLQTGQEETWSFKVKGPQGEKITAELLASMYDASLDEFKPHQWNFSPIYQPNYYGRLRPNSNHSFGNTDFRNTNYFKSPQGYPTQRFDQLNWFGFQFGNLYFRNQYLRRVNSRPSTYEASISSSVEKGYIEGIVVDDSGLALPGATIIIKGAANGVITDFDGNFKLKAKKGEKISIAYVGFKTLDITINNNNFYTISLAEDSNSLDEVVVSAMSVSSAPMEKISKSVALSDTLEEAESDSDGITDSKELRAENSDEENQQEKSKESTQVQIRKNLQETAFFFPHLQTDKDGNVSFSFTTPEALTQWKLQLLAHTKTLESSVAQFETVTQKELMVIPNAPRFLREGDQIAISTKIANLTDKLLSGKAQLILTDAVTGKDISDELIIQSTVMSLHPKEISKGQSFSVDAKSNTQVTWQLTIPEDVQAVEYKVIAKAQNFSDGEQNMLPVLSNRMLVTETLPMWIRSNETKTFTLDKLKNNSSKTLKNHKLTLEVTSNPAWYAVQALPYLMEYPYECNEQTFSRYYANALAQHIVKSNPRIEQVFNQWKSTDALLSNLEKNQELKSLLIEETPWLRDAQSESEQKKRIALLFDLNKMTSELNTALRKLKNGQLPSGAWSWFNGGYENRYITQHIIAGFGHLKKLNVASNAVEQSMIKKAIQYLDNAFVKEYNDLKKYNKDVDLSKDHLSYTQLHYLYVRSFYPEISKSKTVEKITDYYKSQIQKYWLKRSLYAKGLMVLTLHRMNDSATAGKILKSLHENSITSEELGMYWKANSNSWYWYQAPIETQALLIEAFADAGTTIHNEAENTEIIDNLKIWLLKNKQTNQWKTTKATTEAVYALLLQGSDWLSITDTVEVKVGEEIVDPSKIDAVKVEAGTGYFKTAWSSSEIQPQQAEVTLTKKSKGIAWGALYWQYFEDLDNITSAETPLKLSKKLFKKTNSDRGKTLTEITKDTKLNVGDLVTVRIELRSDRSMEFVHLKDMRAAGFEPINVLSQYKWQDGLGYYESTKDAATNFFISYLPKGVFVFEYDVRVNNAGNMSNGITTIQSMYAPEFSSHSEGIRVVVE